MLAWTQLIRSSGEQEAPTGEPWEERARRCDEARRGPCGPGQMDSSEAFALSCSVFLHGMALLMTALPTLTLPFP